MAQENNNNGNGGWGEYGKLVLNELERLEKNQNETQENINEIKTEISKLKQYKNDLEALRNWREDVNDVFSPTQMKEVKDEVYRQKNKWSKAIAIIGFIQFAMGVALLLTRIL